MRCHFLLTGVVAFDEAQIKRWIEHPEEYEQFHREIEYEQHLSFKALMMGSEDQVEVDSLFSVALISGPKVLYTNHETEIGEKARDFRSNLAQFPSWLSSIDSRSWIP